MFMINDEHQEIMENRSHYIAPVQEKLKELFIQEVKTHFVLEFISKQMEVFIENLHSLSNVHKMVLLFENHQYCFKEEVIIKDSRKH